MTPQEIQSLSGLGLRKSYWELRGYTYLPTGCGIVGHLGKDEPSWKSPDGLCITEKEAIESDPAISEREFLKFCAERKLDWAIYINAAGGITAALWNKPVPFDFGDAKEWADPVEAAAGKDSSEARARCMVLALQKEKI